MLEHPQAGNRNEAIERDAHATHYATRDGVHERHKWSKEAQDNTAQGGGRNCDNRSVTGDCYAADAFTVGRVRAATEECADHGTHTIAEQRTGKAGFAAYQILANDARKVFVVCDVLSKHHERYRHVQHRDGAEICPVKGFLCSL